MKKQVKHFVVNISGATAIEYGLIVGIMSVIIIAGFTIFGGSLEGVFSDISTAMGQ